ncbi:MAG: hypothetical protein LUQ07_02925 [Methanospirillum sp.]|nr:hypothetical protein [Methanospirillum sp.]
MQLNTIRLLILTCFFLACTYPVLAADPAFETMWGSYGNDKGQFKYPTGICVDPNTGYVYVADSGNGRIQYFGENGTYIGKWGGNGTENGLFINPQGIAYNPIGDTIYVVDSGNNRIQYFNSIGKYIGKWGKSGSSEGEFSNPYGIATGHNLYLFVTDTNNKRVQYFDHTGYFLSEWKGESPSSLTSLRGIAVNITNYNIYVVDSGINQGEYFSSKGKFLDMYPIQKGITEVAIDPNGYVYHAGTDGYIYYYTQEGKYIGKWGGPGKGQGQFNGIGGMVIIPFKKTLYVVDTGNSRIQRFHLP